MICSDCGSTEFVTRPDGFRRCARFMRHGDPPIVPLASCTARDPAASNVRCERLANHDGQHRTVYQPAAVDHWWSSWSNQEEEQ